LDAFVIAKSELMIGFNDRRKIFPVNEEEIDAGSGEITTH
jgi:hypothetical protein